MIKADVFQWSVTHEHFPDQYFDREGYMYIYTYTCITHNYPYFRYMYENIYIYIYIYCSLSLSIYIYTHRYDILKRLKTLSLLCELALRRIRHPSRPLSGTTADLSLHPDFDQLQGIQMQKTAMTQHHCHVRTGDGEVEDWLTKTSV